MITFLDEHRERFGVEPICDVLEIAPSTYYSAKKRPPSRRKVRDEKLKVDIRRVFEANYGVYGAARYGVSSTGRASSWPAAPWSD